MDPSSVTVERATRPLTNDEHAALEYLRGCTAHEVTRRAYDAFLSEMETNGLYGVIIGLADAGLIFHRHSLADWGNNLIRLTPAGLRALKSGVVTVKQTAARGQATIIRLPARPSKLPALEPPPPVVPPEADPPSNKSPVGDDTSAEETDGPTQPSPTSLGRLTRRLIPVLYSAPSGYMRPAHPAVSPDSAAISVVLRAVLTWLVDENGSVQPTSAAAIAQATNLSETEVEGALAWADAEGLIVRLAMGHTMRYIRLLRKGAELLLELIGNVTSPTPPARSPSGRKLRPPSDTTAGHFAAILEELLDGKLHRIDAPSRSRRLRVSVPMVSYLCGELERRGYIERSGGGNHRNMELLPDGRTWLREYRQRQ